MYRLKVMLIYKLPLLLFYFYFFFFFSGVRRNTSEILSILSGRKRMDFVFSIKVYSLKESSWDCFQSDNINLKCVHICRFEGK